jgi:hypothetical protein
MNVDIGKIFANRASYVSTFESFILADSLSILGSLAQGQTGDLNPAQRDAWLQQIEILKRALPADREGMICFEFVIPRIGKRADNVLLIGDQVIVIEFKVGSDAYDQGAKAQVVDYALDLKNFHAGCHAAIITPVLVATKAPLRLNDPSDHYDGVYPPLLANSQSLAEVIAFCAARACAPVLSHSAWLEAGYRPTPTIVEASQALYRGHQVSDITHSEAGADNLGATTMAISRVIDEVRVSGAKAICLVSGVPGAGKTLAGLNLVCQRRQRDEEGQEHAVFLSGNGPLVKVLQEALARDEVAQAKARDERINKSEAQRKALSFVQNIHHFRDAYLMDPNPPVERVVVFDEAQRAWDRDQTSKFMQQKRGQSDFSQSEPAFLISVMDRHPSWAVIVCLIGGGQEINTGEAGLEEWLRALRDQFPHWRVHVPDRLEALGYLPTFTLVELGERVFREPSLHLGVSLRSFRSEHLSAGIAALMTGQALQASVALAHVLPRFPIVMTRSLELAKAWVRARARGNERFGLLASSGGKRLKPLGIAMEAQIDPCVWFLNGADDVRSSFYLEDAGSEFDVQGLELDWTIVAWDGDLIHQPSGWRYRAFKGTRWQEIRDVDAQRYRLNAYRVLLTRARQGMVIFVPTGDPADPTRSPEFYDPTWRYLKSIGMSELELA